MSDDTLSPMVVGISVAAPTTPTGEVMQIDSASVKKHLGEVVRSTCSTLSTPCPMPKLSLPFEIAIFERYKRRKTSVEKALLEMCYAGVSMRRVEGITEGLGARGSVPAPSATSTQRRSVRLRRGATGRSLASWPTVSRRHLA